MSVQLLPRLGGLDRRELGHGVPGDHGRLQPGHQSGQFQRADAGIQAVRYVERYLFRVTCFVSQFQYKGKI